MTPITEALIMNGPFAGPRHWIEKWDEVINSHRALEERAEKAERELQQAREAERERAAREVLLLTASGPYAEILRSAWETAAAAIRALG